MIFTYTSSRDVLRHEIGRRQKDNPLYSMNAFAKRSGISIAYLSLALRGKRPIPLKTAERLANAAGLKELEREYFLLLVKQEASLDTESHADIEKRLQKIRRKVGTSSKNLLAFDAISDWHHSAILEALTLSNIATAETIANKLELSEEIVLKSLKTLSSLGLIKKQKDGFIRNDTSLLKTSTEVKSQALRNFHKQILRLGANAIENQPIAERSFTGTTIAIDPSRLPEAKQRILEFQRELADFLQGGTPSEIYQLQVQAFRLTGKMEEK